MKATERPSYTLSLNTSRAVTWGKGLACHVHTEVGLSQVSSKLFVIKRF